MLKYVEWSSSLLLLKLVVLASEAGLLCYLIILVRGLRDEITTLPRETIAALPKTFRVKRKPRSVARDKEASRTDRVRCRELSRSKTRWSTAVTSRTGPVRRRNEDYALTYLNADFNALVVADGCGGVPNGDVASKEAAEAAMQASSTEGATSSRSSWSEVRFSLLRIGFASWRAIISLRAAYVLR